MGSEEMEDGRWKMKDGKLADVAGDVNRRVKGGLTMSKRILIGLVMLMVGFAGMSYAVTDSTQTVTLTVTVSPDVKIDIWYLDPAVTTYNFGSGLVASDSSVTLASFTVHNNSMGLVEDFYIRATNAVGVGTPWTLSAAIDKDAYVLYARLNKDAQPTSGDFGASDDLTTSNQAMVTGAFEGSETGDNVPATDGSDTRGLWFKILTPDEVSDTSEKTIWVTVMAGQAG